MSGLSRRSALAGLAILPALAAPALAGGQGEGDAELVALGALIVSRVAAVSAFREVHIEPHEERFEAILRQPSKPEQVRLEEAWAFSRDSGRDAALDELNAFDEETDCLFARLMAIRATTQPGKAAKVRALLSHVMGDGWRGPEGPLDWPPKVARELLAELAGMTADEVAAV